VLIIAGDCAITMPDGVRTCLGFVSSCLLRIDRDFRCCFFRDCAFDAEEGLFKGQEGSCDAIIT